MFSARYFVASFVGSQHAHNLMTIKSNLSYLPVFCVMAAPAVSRSDSDPPDTQLGCSAIDALHGVNHATIKLFLSTRRHELECTY